MKPKVAIVGAGNVGAQAAFLLGLNKLANLVLIDIAANLAQGKALDLAQAFTVLGLDIKVEAGGYELLKDAELIIVTAGLARKPHMSREDLLVKNKEIIETIAEQVAAYAPEATVIVVTNPLDIMTYAFWQKSGLPPQKVFGMGGLLDSGRFRYFLSQASGLPSAQVDGLVIGPHSDMMIPLASQLAPELKANFHVAAVKARNGGAEIVSLLKTGSAFFAPAAALLEMSKAIINNEEKLFSLCCFADNVYGLSDVYLNLPAILGKDGVQKVVELNLSSQEKEALKEAAQALKATLTELGLVG